MKTSFKNYAPKLLSVLVLMVLINSGCKKKYDDTATPGSPGTNEVWMQNTAFNPSTITVAVNTTITWTNKDNMNHNAISNTSGVFNSGTMGNGATFSHKFTTAGTVSYKCTFHSAMTGTVIVQ